MNAALKGKYNKFTLDQALPIILDEREELPNSAPVQPAKVMKSSKAEAAPSPAGSPRFPDSPGYLADPRPPKEKSGNVALGGFSAFPGSQLRRRLNTSQQLHEPETDYGLPIAFAAILALLMLLFGLFARRFKGAQ